MKYTTLIYLACECSNGLIGGVTDPQEDTLVEVVIKAEVVESVMEFHFDNPHQEEHEPPKIEYRLNRERQ